jgi:hypothetical protein
MKRSEMVALIASVLKITGNHYCDDNRDLDDANKILEVIESTGMRPPFFGVHAFSGRCCGKAVEDNLKQRVWEDEDEQK